MNGDDAKKKIVVEKPALLSENLDLRVGELTTIHSWSGVPHEYLSGDEQMCHRYGECTHCVRDIVLRLVASDGRFK